MDNSDFKEQLLNSFLLNHEEGYNNKDFWEKGLAKNKKLFWFIVCLTFWIPLIIIIYFFSASFTDKNFLESSDLRYLFHLFFFFFLTVFIIFFSFLLIIRSILKTIYSNEMSKNEYKKYVLSELINLHNHEKDMITINDKNVEKIVSNKLKVYNSSIFEEFKKYIDETKEDASKWSQIQTSIQSILDILNKQF